MEKGAKKTWWIFLLLALVTLGVYLPSVQFGYVDYDDPAYISGNPYVKQGLSADSVRWAWTYAASAAQMEQGLYEGVTNLWHPLSWMSHMLDAGIWGMDSPGGHHLTSVLLHLASVLVVYLVFARLFGSQWVGLFTALLFAVHPLHVEPVAWLSARKDQLSCLFMFSSLYAYLRIPVKAGRGISWWKAGSVLLYAAALCSKPSVVVMPALLLLIDYKRDDLKFAEGGSVASLWKTVVEIIQTKWLWIIPAVLAAMLTFATQSSGSHAFWIEQSSISGRLQLFAPATWYYLLRSFIPMDLSFHYPRPAWVLQPWLIVTSAALLVAAVAASYRARKKFPSLWFGVVWFLVLLLPVSGLAYVGSSFTADRYMYTALTGLFAALACGMERWLPAMPRRVIGAIIITALALMSSVQLGHWKDSASLFTHAIKAQPHDITGYVNMGSLRQRQGDYQLAAQYYLQALELNKNDYVSWFNLGNCRRHQSDEQGAIEAYRKSLEIYPHYSPSRFNLAHLLLNPGSRYHDLNAAAQLLEALKASGNYRPDKVKILWDTAQELKRLHR